MSRESSVLNKNEQIIKHNRHQTKTEK